jgi:hypothetical protein
MHQPTWFNKCVAIYKRDVVDSVEITHRHVVPRETKVLTIPHRDNEGESPLNFLETSIG